MNAILRNELIADKQWHTDIITLERDIAAFDDFFMIDSQPNFADNILSIAPMTQMRRAHHIYPLQFASVTPPAKKKGILQSIDAQALLPPRLMDLDGQRRRASIILNAAKRKVASLERVATQDGEPFASQSGAVFLSFLRRNSVTKLPAIFCSSNGNIRSIWQDTTGAQIAIQFLPDDRGQFVIFRHGVRDGRQILGVEDLQTISFTLRFLKLDRLMNDQFEKVQLLNE